MRRLRTDGGRGCGEDGFAMLFVIFAIMVIGILGAATMLFATIMLRNSVGVTPSSRALAAAEAGLDVAHAMLAAEEPELMNLGEHESYTLPQGSLWSGNGTFDVTVTRNPDEGDGDPYDWKVESNGEYKSYVEGVERTFYRGVEEVISFAGGSYYTALDYIMFSKEGDIDLNLDGDFSALKLEYVSIGEEGAPLPSNLYAGGDITLADSAKVFVAAGGLEVYGKIVTEYGDVLVRNATGLVGASNVYIEGAGIYSGILNPGGVGGGVNLESDISVAGLHVIEIDAPIKAQGRLNDYPYGVRISNSVVAAGGATTHIGGSIRSIEDIYGANNLDILGATTEIDIDGNIHCAGDVEFRNEMFVIAIMDTDISGSIYAGGDVDIYGSGAAGGYVASTVGGGIHSAGDVNIYQGFGGITNGGGYSVGGSIYGRNVDLESQLIAVGNISNAVGGSVYARGDFSLSSYAGPSATCDAIVSGSAYSLGDFDMSSRANGGGFLVGQSRAYVNGGGGVIDPPNLAGGFAGGTMSLSAQENFHLFVHDKAITRVQPNARRSSGTPSITEIDGGDVQEGTTTPEVGSFTVPSATAPQLDSEDIDHPEVLMPECDFDYYRQKAREQELTDPGHHYYQGDTTITLNEADFDAFKSATHVVFVDGEMTLQTVEVPLDTVGVFVATGDIHLSDIMRLGDDAQEAECQLISNGKVDFGPGFNFSVSDDDRIFIYAGHEDYDPDDPNERVSVNYEMGWFRDVWMQVTARGDIVISSHPFAFTGLAIHRIKYKNPSVLGDAFRIPFTVKYWKET
ncbi:MAG: hypothetical protein SWK76_16175 [Actinomycetota bacterium]|nr:hypothetical protein [Actinomycetota bacterium]